MNKIVRIYAESFKGLSIESWMLSVVMLINRTGSMVLPFLGIYMVDHLGFELGESGMVLSCFGIGAVLGSWIGGYVTDKIGEYPVQAFSLFVSVPLFCLYPFFTTPGSLAAIVLIQSITSELFRPANSVAITKYADPRSITRAFSLNRMAVNLGFSIGPAMGGLLAAISYNFLFFVNAAAALAAGIVYIRFFGPRYRKYDKKDKATRRREAAAKKAAAKGASAYLDWKFWMFCAVCSLFAISFFQLMNTLPLFYKNEIKLSRQLIGILMGLNGFVVVLFEMPLVRMAERKLNLAQAMLAGTMLCALSYLILGFHPDFMLLVLSMSFLSLGEILVLPFMSTITALRAQAYNKGTYMGINGMSISIAFIISPLLGTRLAGLYGFSNLWIATAAALTICGFAYYFFVPLLLRKND